jgi:SulP family sulfate permease
VLIGVSQLKDLFGLHIEKLPADFFTQVGALASHAGSVNPAALALGLGCLALVALWPKRWKAVPAPIVALVLATLATALLQLPVETIGSRFGGIPQGLPRLALPPFSWASAQQLLIPTLTIALLGAVESLLCARVADNLSEAPRHDPNQELMGQGVANMVAPLFGGIPATGTIARTVTNVRSGATSPVAGIVHAATLLAVVLVAAPLAVHVPLAGLAGILLFVAWNMGEWHEFARLRRFSLHYRTVLLGTFALTVVFDLTVAVQFGLVLACVFFIYRMSTLFRIEACESAAAGVQVFALSGPLFFGAVGTLEALPARVLPGTRAVVLDLQRMLSMDTSGLDALAQCQRSLARRGVALFLAGVDAQPLSLIRRAGFEAELGAGRIVADRGEAETAAETAAKATAEAAARAG